MQETLAKNFVDLLCDHFGDRVMLEVFLERWGIRTLYAILSDIVVGENLDGAEQDGQSLPE